MLTPEADFSLIHVYWNEELAGVAERVPRPDVGAVFTTIPHAGRSGFAVRINTEQYPCDRYTVFTLVGFLDDRPRVRLDFVHLPELPPAGLIQRVTGTADQNWFKSGGHRSCDEFLEAIRRQRDLASVRRLLDWGCGCGRVAVHLIHKLPGVEIYGTDIDAVAVQWCDEHIRPGHFAVSGTHPPLPFGESMFDVVVAFSVFTHLTQETQESWLAELRRIITPGGLLLATVHGDSCIAECERLKGVGPKITHGFSDEIIDPALDGVAPDNYYRGTFQTRDYTLRTWSRHFDILEYVPKGALDAQDLVVMRGS
jgi:ubiquinone/menaquinone biosynthesis C-methylase UbiE